MNTKDGAISRRTIYIHRIHFDLDIRDESGALSSFAFEIPTGISWAITPWLADTRYVRRAERESDRPGAVGTVSGGRFEAVIESSTWPVKHPIAFAEAFASLIDALHAGVGSVK
jgi:hypothetical protein